MRLAIVPNPTFRALEGESEFLMVRQFARDVLAVRDDVFFYVVVPGWCKPPGSEDGIRYIVDDSDSNLAFHDRIATVPLRFPDWFSQRHGQYPVDAVFTTRTAAVAMMTKYLRDFREKATVPVFIDESIAIDRSLPEYFAGDEDLMARSLGYASACKSFFDTDWERERAVKAARRYLSGSYVRTMMDRLEVVPCGVNVKRVDALKKGVRRSRTFQVLCGNRLNASKRPEKVVELYNHFFSFGRNVRIVLSSPEPGTFFDKLKDKSHIKICRSLDSDSFVKLAARSHVIVETTRFGGFSIGLSEMILAGPVVILPRLKWIKSLVGPLWKKFPFFYKTWDEAAGMLRHVHENFDDAGKKMEPMRKFWRKNYDSKQMSLKMFEVVESGAKEVLRSSLWSKGNVDLIKDGLKEMCEKQGLKVINLELLYLYMIDNSRVMKTTDMQHPLRGRLSKWSVYRWMLANGWRDTCTGHIPTFVREEA